MLLKTGKHFGLKLQKKDETKIMNYKKCRLEAQRAFRKLDFNAIQKLRQDMHSYGMKRELNLLNWVEENSEVKLSSLKYRQKFAIAFRDVKALKALQQLERVDQEGSDEMSAAAKILREIEEEERSIKEQYDQAKIEAIVIKAGTKFYNFESVQNILSTVEELDMQAFAMELLAEPSLPKDVLEEFSGTGLDSKETSDRENHSESKAPFKNSDKYNTPNVKPSKIAVSKIEKVTQKPEVFPKSKVHRSKSPTYPSNHNQSLDEKFLEQNTSVEDGFPEPVTDSDSTDREPRDVKDEASSAFLGRQQITSPTASNDSHGHIPTEKICHSISPLETTEAVLVDYKTLDGIPDEKKAYKKPKKREVVTRTLFPKLDNIQSV